MIGNGLPKFYLGWTNQFAYKNWDASVTQRGAFGFQIINVARMYYENLSRQDWNRLKSAYDPVFGVTQLSSQCAEEFNSYYVEDGDYWKIDNVTIGYTFKNIPRLIKSIRVYASGNNLLCFSDFKLWDPEMGGYGIGYPTQRVYNVGLNVEF